MLFQEAVRQWQLPSSQSKYRVPGRRPNAVARPRLDERLNAALSSRLTVLSAPAGFGKTTVLTEWLATSGRARRRSPGSRWTSATTTPRGSGRTSSPPSAGRSRTSAEPPRGCDSSPPATEAALAALLNELGGSKRDLLLVLDDYHLVEAADVHEGMTFLLEHQPPQLHVALATRTDPPLSTSPSMYLLSSQTSRLLPVPAWPMTDTKRSRRSRADACRNSLSRRRSSWRPTNGGSRPSALPTPPTFATTRSARYAVTGRSLPRRACSPAGSNVIAPLETSIGRLADEDLAGSAARLEPAGGVDQVAGDHPLADRADVDGRLAAHHRGPRPQRRAIRTGMDLADGLDEVEGGPDRALRVVLVGDRRAPGGHHGVADELLDRAAVAADDVAGELEVASTGARGPSPGRVPQRRS